MKFGPLKLGVFMSLYSLFFVLLESSDTKNISVIELLLGVLDCDKVVPNMEFGPLNLGLYSKNLNITKITCIKRIYLR